ncbi:MAG: sulfatase-like hydrolase/transferase [Bacteroidales bacterium]|jgi:phosphoglycerol transferase MdoB-like AlkP superfamily enzyme|nr:sulfatase-like hydrolase/transferase [Bacteroidales bacterium]
MVSSFLKPYNHLLRVYLWGIVFFTLFRIIILLTLFQEAGDAGPMWWLIGGAMWYGWRFDTVISGYLLSIPLVVSAWTAFTGKGRLWTLRFSHYWLLITYLLSFAICATDIPYFAHYFTRLDVAVFQWVDSPKLMIGMVLGEIRYAIFILLFLAISIAWFFIMKSIFQGREPLKVVSPHKRFPSHMAKVITFIILSAFCLLAIRGRIDKKSPIRTGTAWFSEHPFYNQAGLNPVFTLVQSWIDQRKAEGNRLALMPDKEAIYKVREILKIDDTHFVSPLARKIEGKPDSLRLNVVVIIMEGMSMWNTGMVPEGKHLTPVLDSLAETSLTFRNFYSAGIHTFNGVFSTLYGFPALKRQHPMNQYPIPEYTGLPATLKEKGYLTFAFIPHDDQFDNMGGFFRANGFEKVFSPKNYHSRPVSSLGVPDHKLFEESLQILDKELSQKDGPFFAAILTASNHGPYILPKDFNFKPVAANLPDKMVEYADKSIGYFLKMASYRPWFKNTLFVLTADHGVSVNPRYELPLSFNHIPLLFIAPGGQLPPAQMHVFGNQTDIYSTTMGILGYSYTNNTVGNDLLQQPLGFTYFSADDRLGIITDEFYLIIKDDQPLALYNLKTDPKQNILKDMPAVCDSLKSQVWSFLQASQYVIRNGLSGKKGVLPKFGSSKTNIQP